MKRARSALSLRNLAHSIQQSIQATQTRSNRTVMPLKASRSSAQLLKAAGEERQKAKERVENQVFVLERQIVGVQKQIEETTSTVRDYTKQLDQYQIIQAKIAEKGKHLQSLRAKSQQLANRLMVLSADKQSQLYNAQQRIAELEYYEQLLSTYQQQYPEEHQQVACIISSEQAIIQEERQLSHLMTKIDQTTADFAQWKKDSQYSLNSHKVRHSAKLIRMQMMECEDACDSFCRQHQVLKIREVYCQFFKNYSRRNGVDNEAAAQGIDLFICRNGLLDDFVEEYREKLCLSQPPFGGFETYLLLLSELEQLYSGKKERSNQKTHQYYTATIHELKQEKEEIFKRIKVYQKDIAKAEETIERVFGNNSIALIECMREENNNKYDLKAIRQKLKLSKQEQNQRIAKVKQAHASRVRLEGIISADGSRDVNEEMQLLVEKVQGEQMENEMEICSCEREMDRLKADKERLQRVINEAVSTWKQRDLAKSRLKKLYKQLQTAKSSPHIQCEPPLPIEPYHQSKSQSIIAKHPLRSSNHSNGSSILGASNKSSLLSLTNPYKQIISQQMDNYKPVISECKMVLSKKIVHRGSHQPHSRPDDDSQGRLVLESRYDAQRKSRKGQGSKENIVWPKRNKSYTTTQNKVSKTGGVSAKGKGKMSDSQRKSLSNLLLSKFNR